MESVFYGQAFRPHAECYPIACELVHAQSVRHATGQSCPVGQQILLSAKQQLFIRRRSYLMHTHTHTHALSSFPHPISSSDEVRNLSALSLRWVHHGLGVFAAFGCSHCLHCER